MHTAVMMCQCPDPSVGSSVSPIPSAGARRSGPVAATRSAARVGLLAFALALALGGCASEPLQPLSPSIPAQWRQATEAGAEQVDLRGWWHAFHDPQLDALVDTALHDNLNVAAAHEHLLAARALARVATAPYLPSVRAKTDDAIDPDASASFLVAGFDAVWEFPLFGRGTAARRQAEGNRDAAEADLQQARVSLVGEVVRDWLELRAAQQRMTVQAQAQHARRQQLELWRVRERLHLVGPDRVAAAEAALAEATASLSDATQEADGSAHSLAALLGRPEPDPAWLAPAALPDLGQLAVTTTPADLLRTRPDIARAQADVLSAAGDAGIAHANLFPSIGIGGSIVWSTNLTTHRRTNDNAIASAGPILTIPLFDWGLLQAQSHAKNHELKAAVLAYRQVVLNGVAEVENALGQLARQKVRERQATLAASASARTHAAITRRVQLGLDNRIDQLDSALALDRARLAAIDARAARGVAFVSLYKALGGAPLPDDAQPLPPSPAPVLSTERD